MTGEGRQGPPPAAPQWVQGIHRRSRNTNGSVERGGGYASYQRHVACCTNAHAAHANRAARANRAPGGSWRASNVRAPRDACPAGYSFNRHDAWTNMHDWGCFNWNLVHKMHRRQDPEEKDKYFL